MSEKFLQSPEQQNRVAENIKDQFTDFYMRILQENLKQLADLGLEGITSSTIIAEGKDAQTYYAEDVFTIIFGQRERAQKIVNLIDTYFDDKDEEALEEVKGWLDISFVKNRFFIAQEVSSQMFKVLKDVVERVDLFINITNMLTILLDMEGIYDHVREKSNRPAIDIGVSPIMSQDEIDLMIYGAVA